MAAAQILKITFADIRSILLVCYALVIITTIVVIIRDRRDPVKGLSWIMVVTLIPILGIIMYILFGRNHRRLKIFNQKEIEDLKHIEKLCSEQLLDLVDPEIQHIEPVESNKDIITLLLNNNKSVLTVRNKVTILNNGKAKFKELFKAIEEAKSSIHLEYYIFENDRIGKRVLNLLEKKAAEGVEVRLIVDDLGSWGIKNRHIKKIKRRGIDIRQFMPVAFPYLSGKINYRNHRKIAVMDGRVGFTGGINIAERYLKGTKFGPWRDTHLRIEGDAVNMMQAIFATDWYFVGDKELLFEDKYYPKTKIRTRSPIQIASSGPDSDWASIMQAYFAAMNKAKKSIYITTPYFMPNQSILTALKVASLSGVDVRIILPYKSDSKIVYWASRSYISELLDAGIKVYFFQKGFCHSKLIIIDGTFCSVGSANMDYRSFEDNFEVAAIMYDPRVAAELTEYFMQDIENSVLITDEMWESRSNLHAMYESLSRLFSPLL